MNLVDAARSGHADRPHIHRKFLRAAPERKGGYGGWLCFDLPFGGWNWNEVLRCHPDRSYGVSLSGSLPPDGSG